MTPRKKLVRKDVIRLARQKLWTDIGKALDSYEKHVYGDRALTSRASQIEESHNAIVGIRESFDPPSRIGDITTSAEIAAILPPEPPQRRRAGSARGRVSMSKDFDEPDFVPAKRSPVSQHIRGEEAPKDRVSEHVRDTINGLGSSEEKVLILIAQSQGGMTPAQIAIKVALKKRSIQNILTSLKSQRYVIKDANHGKFRITEEGRTAIEGRYWKPEKGAILAELSDSGRRVLFAIASKEEGVTVSALSVMVPGIKKRTKQNILTALKTRELIEKSGDRFTLTEYAREELKGKLEKPLTGKALREKLLESLPEPQAAVLDWLSYDGGRTATAEELAGSLGYATRTVQNIFTALKAQEFITKHDGRFQLSSHLKD